MRFEWKQSHPGFYTVQVDRYMAIVKQDGELWRSYAYVDCVEVDRGEWDGRRIALRNATVALVNAAKNRDPVGTLVRDMQEDEG